jgi:hypothetical protein
MMQDLAALASTSGNLQGRSTIIAKVQGPFEGHSMSPAEERVFGRMVVCAGGIGATAVLPMLLRSVLHRGKPLKPRKRCNKHNLLRATNMVHLLCNACLSMPFSV